MPTAPWTASVEELLRRQGTEFDLVYLHRVEMAQRYLPLIRHSCHWARSTRRGPCWSRCG